MRENFVALPVSLYLPCTALPVTRDSRTPIHACSTATPACTHCSAAVSSFAQSANSVRTAATPTLSTISMTGPTASVTHITVPHAVAALSPTVAHITVPAATCAPCITSVPALPMTVAANPNATAFPLGSSPTTTTQPRIGDSAVLKDMMSLSENASTTGTPSQNLVTPSGSIVTTSSGTCPSAPIFGSSTNIDPDMNQATKDMACEICKSAQFKT